MPQAVLPPASRQLRLLEGAPPKRPGKQPRARAQPAEAGDSEEEEKEAPEPVR